MDPIRAPPLVPASDPLIPSSKRRTIVKSSMCNGAIKDYCITVDTDPNDRDVVLITATEIPDQPTVRATLGEWHAFVEGVKAGDFDVLPEPAAVAAL